MIDQIEAELIYLTDIICGESPVWDEEHQQLYWLDLVGAALYIFNPEDGTNESYPMEGVLGALALREKGGVLLAAEKGFSFFDSENAVLQAVTDPEKRYPDHYFGDGKCDPQGRFWAGTYHKDIREAKGTLYSLDSDLSVKVRHRDIILSNGLGWSSVGDKFYHIDSVAQSIYAFDYHPDNGDISNQKLVRKIEGEQLLPDGMTLDAGGFLWVAVFNAGKVLRIHPQTGETVFEVRVPSAKQVTSCTFGGKDLNELYITTAKEIGGPYGIPEEELNTQQHAGGLFKATLPFKGLPPVKFKG